MASIEYRIGDVATWTTYSTPLTFDEPGTYVVRYRATDKAGNTNTGELSRGRRQRAGRARRSRRSPLSTMPRHPPRRTVAPTGTPRRSRHPHGCRRQGELDLEYRIGNGAWTTYTAPFTVSSDGVHPVQARATDAAGTASAIQTLTVKMDATAPTVAVDGIADGARLDVAAVRTLG